MNLVQMPAPSGETCEQVLQRALEAAREGAFDEIVIVAQKAKTTASVTGSGSGPGSGPGTDSSGSVAWFGRDGSTIATTIYLLQTAMFHFNCLIAGIKL